MGSSDGYAVTILTAIEPWTMHLKVVKIDSKKNTAAAITLKNYSYFEYLIKILHYNYMSTNINTTNNTLKSKMYHLLFSI
jgi:hypothetical protein